MATKPDFKADLLRLIIADAGGRAAMRCVPAAHCYHRRMIPGGETRRLLLRPLELADSAQIQETFPQWEVVHFLLNRVPWPYPPDGALQHLRDVALPGMERGDSWIWTLRLKTDPEKIVGLITLTRETGNNRGFWLAPPHHGQGLMSEACEWANDFWFDTLEFPVLRVSKAVANVASRRISEKQGMRKVGDTENDYVCGRLPSEIWEITAEEWRAWKAARKKMGEVDGSHLRRILS